MLVFLSSGTRERYLDDIVRSMALPEGTDIQFRYSQSWISAGALEALRSGSARHEVALISYIDQSTNGTIYYVPCREAQVVETSQLGSSVVVRLRVGRFLSESDFDRVRLALDSNIDSPKWVGNDVKGRWVLKQNDLTLDYAKPRDLVAWEVTVKELLKRNDFKARDFFFYVTRIGKGNSETTVPDDGTYVLKPSIPYSISVYHFHPTGDSISAKSITLSPSTSDVTLFSVPSAKVDSRYDMKRWNFDCQGGILSKNLVFEVRTSSSGDAKDNVTQIEIPARISVGYLGLISKIALVWLGLFGASLTTLTAAGKFSWGTGIAAALAAALATAGTIWKSK